MGNNLLEHRIVKDYGPSPHIDLRFDRDGVFWALLFYELEAQEQKSASKKR
tara:strand:+ start:338 stop:490 length:153 start_codon:yes stop_codon:yes gene_type:complete